MFTVSSLPPEPPAATIPNPHPPRGQPTGCAVELDDRRASRRLRRAFRQDERRARAYLCRPHGDKLDPAVSVGVAVPLLVRGVEALREIGAQPNGQLVRLADVTKIGLSVGRQVADVRERPDLRPDVIAPLVAHPEPHPP